MKQALTNEQPSSCPLASWAIVFLLMLAACGETNPVVKPADDTALLKSFLEQQPLLASVFAKPAKEKKIPFALNVYVDQSASMRGYLDSVGKAPPKKKSTTGSEVAEAGPRLFSLLRQLANQSELLRFHAFGKLQMDTSSSPDTITPLDKQAPVNARDYIRKNNDYASLIDHIKQQEGAVNSLPVQHMIISDGVQSHHNPGEGSALSRTIASLKQWIDAGGIVEVRLIKSTFSGKYYSEELRAFQQANASGELVHSFIGYAPARPFLVISLLSGTDVLPAWNSFWNRSGMQAIKVEKAVLFPDLDSQRSRIEMKFNEVVAKTLAPEMKYFNVWKNFTEVPTVDGYLNLFSAQVAQVRTTSSDSPETYPAVLHLKGEKALDVIEEFKAAKPTLRVWKMQKSAAFPHAETRGGEGVAPVDGASAESVPPAQPAPPPPKWLQLAGEELKGTPSDIRQIFVQKPAPYEQSSPNEANVLLRLPLQPRNEIGDIVVVSLTPAPPAELQVPDFRDCSCIDDSTPETLDRIYNLQQWVEQFSEAVKPVAKEEGILVITHR